MASLESAYEQVTKLVEDFKNNEHYYASSKYSEAQVRKDFIDKFFIALGWDVNHDEQKDPYRQEVKVEKSVAVESASKRADYAFYLLPNFKEPVFYVEAKKPAHNLLNPYYYFQAIRYGWNANTPVIALTDFEEFHVIDSRYKPNLKTAIDRKLQNFHYTDYLDKDKFAKIYYLFSRESVQNNSIGNYADALKKIKGKAIRKGALAGIYKSIDESFLEELDEIRNHLAKAFKKSNPNLESDELTEAVQRTIDRLVFIRFLEAKLIEGESHISAYLRKGSAWGNFITDSKALNAKYNGIVFKEHFIDMTPSSSRTLPLGKGETAFNPPDDKVFSDICKELAHEESPYDFNLIPIHILGSIYEQFLGKVVHATEKLVKIEEKPEVRKAGGVYYTPQYIVKYIVDNTVGKILRGETNTERLPLAKGESPKGVGVGKQDEKPDSRFRLPEQTGGNDNMGLTPKQISKLRFADISCGSGSFLITVFDTLLEYIGKWYQSHPDAAKKDGCILNNGMWVLSLKQKRDILLNNIYGVDIDYQAVEVTQLSLFLKLLEDETLATAYEMQTLFKERILPDLSKNIVCGNSLIGTDINEGELFATTPSRWTSGHPSLSRRGHKTSSPYEGEVPEGQRGQKGGSELDEKKINAMNFEDAFPHIFKSPPVFPLPRGSARRTMGSQVETDEGQGSQGFDAIVGNPPYLKLTINNQELPIFNYYKKKYKCLESGSSKNLFQLFIEKALTLVNGRFSYIVPEALLTTKSNDLLRNKLDNIQNHIQSIVTFENFVFSEATIGSAIFVLDKKYLNEEVEYLLMNKNGQIVSSSKLSRINNPDIWQRSSNSEYKDLLNKINQNCENLGSISKMAKGMVVQGRKEVLEKSKTNSNYPFLLGNCMNRYYYKYDLFATYEKLIIIGGTSNLDKHRSVPRLLIRRTGNIICATLSQSPELIESTIYILTSDNYDLKYLLGILNSNLLTFYLQKGLITNAQGFPQILMSQLEKLPIRKIDLTNPVEKLKYDKIITLVDQMLEAKKKQHTATTERDKSFWENKCNSLDRQIDSLVYELYGLTEEEIKIVEGK